MSRSTDWTPSLWRETFDELLNEDDVLDYEDQWSLNFNYSQTDKVTKEERKRGWKIYSHCAFGNFQCPHCGNSWRSARVVVLFRYRLRNDRGSVIMRPFGQCCRGCEDDFYLPGFTEKEVEHALLRLFSKIRKNCYGEEDDDDDGDAQSRPNKPTKPHESDLCEACRMGICCLEDE